MEQCSTYFPDESFQLKPRNTFGKHVNDTFRKVVTLTRVSCLADTLGARLETSEKYRSYACLCYICSGNIENLVRCWDAVKPEANDAQKKCDAVQVRLPATLSHSLLRERRRGQNTNCV